ncbi:Ribosomal protein L18e/L15P [Dillenia turbinata]|uniref:Ribosomal protein L18e/L15P n=1 Tax=Dillenia turbinata TaxID=194707 RepID=A0AAN8UYU5_9MAGN
MAALLSLSSSSLTTSFKVHPSLPLAVALSLSHLELESKPISLPTSKTKCQDKGEKITVLVVVSQASPLTAVAGSNVRFRLDNLGPQPGSRKMGKRKGRGHTAGQGGSCGFGMRGQKSESGPGVRRGFEGGQMPLYRRIPKLRGIAGEYGSLDYARELFEEMGEEDEVAYGAIVSRIIQESINMDSLCNLVKTSRTHKECMRAYLSMYPVNLIDIEAAGFKEGEEVSLESLKEKGLIDPSGRERTLPL